ncbi:hypothetical protein [Streptomyces sp. CoH17]|uniref:hypothetical protein n=1 Tax=Streptomyces sp. CoH17 TaxID=2992806 RepID=UPI0022713216|nr:hypothetical protein [Streptomyces sp. CoH17]
MNTHVDNTYGGRVVQLLSTNIDTLSISAEGGRGGRQYLHSTALFFRDLVLYHRDTQNPVVFMYAPKNYLSLVYADRFEIKDDLTNVLFPYTMTFKIVEDLNGAMTQKVMSAELSRLKEGIGYVKSGYNDPLTTEKKTEAPKTPSPHGGSGQVAPEN